MAKKNLKNSQTGAKKGATTSKSKQTGRENIHESENMYNYLGKERVERMASIMSMDEVLLELASSRYDDEEKKQTRRERLRMMITDLNITQRRLAEQLMMEPSYLSAILNGQNGRGLSDNLAAKIHNLYPQYSLKWLLGLSSDSGNGEDNKENTDIRDVHDEWTFDFITAVTGVNLRHFEELSVLPYDLQTITDTGYNINGKLCLLSPDEVRELLAEIRAFASFKIDYILKTKDRAIEKGLYSMGEAYDLLDKELHERALELAEMDKANHEKAIEAVINILRKYIYLDDEYAYREAEGILAPPVGERPDFC